MRRYERKLNLKNYCYCLHWTFNNNEINSVNNIKFIEMNSHRSVISSTSGESVDFFANTNDYIHTISNIKTLSPYQLEALI